MANFLGGDGTYGLIKNALDAANLRQQTISNNIANVNTKNYKANRVLFEEKLRKAMGNGQVTLRATHSNHIGIYNENQQVQPEIIKERATSMRNDGNNVDIDLEMANLAANQLLYNALIQQANSKISTLRYVIKEGRG